MAARRLPWKYLDFPDEQGKTEIRAVAHPYYRKNNLYKQLVKSDSAALCNSGIFSDISHLAAEITGELGDVWDLVLVHAETAG